MAKLACHSGVKWCLFVDTPDQSLVEELKARESVNGKKATDMLAEARKKCDAGQYDDAEKLTYQAEALRKEYPPWYRGERPDRLRAEIVSKRRVATKTQLPPLLGPAANKP